jgi:hypothetical protein
MRVQISIISVLDSATRIASGLTWRGTHHPTSIVAVLLLVRLFVPVSLGAQRPFEGQLPARPAGTIAVEAESLVGSAQATHGKVFSQDMRSFGPGWSGNAQLFWAVAQPGAQLRLSVSMAAAGRYQVFLHFTRAPDYALIRASFDGAAVVSINGYAAGVSRDRALLGMLDLAPGAHELLLEVAMKDGKSTGLNVGLDRIELEPVVDRGAVTALQNAAAAAQAMAVPVLHVPAGGAPARQSPVQAVEPLPMATRIEVARSRVPPRCRVSPVRRCVSRRRPLPCHTRQHCRSLMPRSTPTR